MYLLEEKYFNNKEYLLGDSVFSASSVLVPAFEKDSNSNLREENSYFNTKLAKLHIKSSNFLGLLKAYKQDHSPNDDVHMHLAQPSDQPCHPTRLAE